MFNFISNKYFTTNFISKLYNIEQDNALSAYNLLEIAKEQYNVYHIHINHKLSVKYNNQLMLRWKKLIDDNLFEVNNAKEAIDIIFKKVIEKEYKNNEIKQYSFCDIEEML